MGLNIKDDSTHRLAKQLSSLTGESMTKAVKVALEERLKREAAKRGRGGVASRLMEIGRRCSSRRVLDDREADTILGYDRDGVPG
ncbi:MAG: type II toxin-antitoxin system VapB family antitoxin [Kiloniellales bacterium]|nr:type II toxin-antitoxin system VapB family antitoxin [Kiloniellales bacterium]